MAAFFRESARASHSFPNPGNRDDHTYDPQTPPSASPDGLQRQQLRFARNGVPTWLVSNWIATLGRTALCLPEFALQSDVRPRAGDGTSIFLAVWEFEVKPGCQERFLKVYGPEGDWAKLFRKDANYQETQLLHDLSRGATYLTLLFDFGFLGLAAGI